MENLVTLFFLIGFVFMIWSAYQVLLYCYNFFFELREPKRREKARSEQDKIMRIFDPLFVVNTNNGVTAICLKEDFDGVVINWIEGKEPWKLILVSLPERKLFFFSDDSRRDGVCGSNLSEIRRAIFDRVIQEFPALKGIPFWNFIQKIEKEDKRLQVPYSNKNLEQDYSKFGQTDPEEAKKILLGHLELKLLALSSEEL